MGIKGEQITWDTLEEIFYNEDKDSVNSRKKTDDEEEISAIKCPNGDDLTLGTKKSNNARIFFISRESKEGKKGTIFLDSEALIGLTNVIRKILSDTISVQTQLVIDYPSLKNLWLSLGVIQIGITSQIMFNLKNKTDGSIQIQLENLKINGINYPNELKSGLMPYSKKNKEVWFAIGPIFDEIKKLEMNIAVHTHIYENPQVLRKGFEVKVDSDTHKITTHILSNSIESSNVISSHENIAKDISSLKMKEQVLLYTHKNSNNDVINFGKGLINSETYFYIKKIKDNIVSGRIYIERSTLFSIFEFLNNGIPNNTKSEDLFKGMNIFWEKKIFVRLSNVIRSDKPQIVFKVKNQTNDNIILLLNNILMNGVYVPITLKSKLIPSSSQKRNVKFEFEGLNRKNIVLQMSVEVKTHNYDKPYSLVRDIEIIIDEKGKVICKRITEVNTAVSNQLKSINQSPLPQKANESSQLKQNSTTNPFSLIETRYFFVYTDNLRCKRLGHEPEKDYAVIGVARMKSGTPYIQQYSIPVCVCNKCKAYYISESVYKEIRSNGRFLPRIISLSEFNNNKLVGTAGSEHIMYKFGYSVRENGPSSKQRHVLLEQLIESKVVSKKEAINHIKGLIRRNRFNKNMGDAIKKWEDDIEYLTGKRLEIGVKAIVVSKDILNSRINKFPD